MDDRRLRRGGNDQRIEEVSDGAWGWRQVDIESRVWARARHPLAVDHGRSTMKHLVGEIARHSGLHVSAGSHESLERHLERRMRALGLTRPEDFLDHLRLGSPSRAEELRRLALVLTTGETFFMRDAGQMALLRETLLPALLRTPRDSAGIRIWSAACSTGEEPYSLAILLHQLAPDLEGQRLTLYGTDVSPEAIRAATAGNYGQWAFRGCDEALRERYFAPQGAQWRIKDEPRRLVRFQLCDLLHDPLPDPSQGLAEMDLILCRNFFIYLQPDAVALVADKLVGCLREGGVLMTGHGELGARAPRQLDVELYPQSVIYRKCARSQEVSDAGQVTDPVRSSQPTGSDGTLEHGPAAGSRMATRRLAWQRTRVSHPSGGTPAHRQLVAPASERTSAVTASASGSGEAALRQAWRLADAGRVRDAQAECQRLLAADPMQAEAHYLDALLHLELGDVLAARASLRRVLYLDPTMSAASRELARLGS